jgi:hypothetical protein
MFAMMGRWGADARPGSLRGAVTSTEAGAFGDSMRLTVRFVVKSGRGRFFHQHRGAVGADDGRCLLDVVADAPVEVRGRRGAPAVSRDAESHRGDGHRRENTEQTRRLRDHGGTSL